MEKEVELKDYRINELNIAVNDLRGKFIKPTLKTVKKKEFAMDEGEAEKKKPGWALGAKDGEGVARSGSEGGGLNSGVEEEEPNIPEVEGSPLENVEEPAAENVEEPAAVANDEEVEPPAQPDVDKEVGEMADVAA